MLGATEVGGALRTHIFSAWPRSDLRRSSAVPPSRRIEVGRLLSRDSM
jgi:hypothetical protein